MKNKAVNATNKFEKIVMVMIIVSIREGRGEKIRRKKQEAWYGNRENAKRTARKLERKSCRFSNRISTNRSPPDGAFISINFMSQPLLE